MSAAQSLRLGSDEDELMNEIFACFRNHFGWIPGVETGKMWRNCVEVRSAGVHRVPGWIHGCKSEGAYSIMLSNPLACPKIVKDFDHGSEIMMTYPVHRSSANAVMIENCYHPVYSHHKTQGLSSHWQKGHPVRVVRSYKFQPYSEFAPEEGYRYDGIYKVKQFWKEKDARGQNVVRYNLFRDDPNPAPWTELGKARGQRLHLHLQPLAANANPDDGYDRNLIMQYAVTGKDRCYICFNVIAAGNICVGSKLIQNWTTSGGLTGFSWFHLDCFGPGHELVGMEVPIPIETVKGFKELKPDDQDRVMKKKVFAHGEAKVDPEVMAYYRGGGNDKGASCSKVDDKDDDTSDEEEDGEYSKSSSDSDSDTTTTDSETESESESESESDIDPPEHKKRRITIDDYVEEVQEHNFEEELFGNADVQSDEVEEGEVTSETDEEFLVPSPRGTKRKAEDARE